MSDWIKLSECSPLVGGKIFVYNLPQNYGPFVCDDPTKINHPDCKWTHWMPAVLPEPPKPDKSQKDKDWDAYVKWVQATPKQPACKDFPIPAPCFNDVWSAAIAYERQGVLTLTRDYLAKDPMDIIAKIKARCHHT